MSTKKSKSLRAFLGAPWCFLLGELGVESFPIEREPV
jgi:hypothetical protein